MRTPRGHPKDRGSLRPRIQTGKQGHNGKPKPARSCGTSVNFFFWRGRLSTGDTPEFLANISRYQKRATSESNPNSIKLTEIRHDPSYTVATLGDFTILMS